LSEISSNYLTLLLYNVFCNSIGEIHVITFAGGGPSIAPPLTPAEEAMAQLINPAVVYGISDSLQSESAEAVAEISK